VPGELADGTYDVEVTAWRGNSRSVDTGTTDLRIDTKPPAAPTVDRISANRELPQISGSWPSDDVVRLEVQVLDRVYQLGTDPELIFAVPGRWTLSLLQPVPDGATDVVAVLPCKKLLSPGFGRKTRRKNPIIWKQTRMARF